MSVKENWVNMRKTNFRLLIYGKIPSGSQTNCAIDLLPNFRQIFFELEIKIEPENEHRDQHVRPEEKPKRRNFLSRVQLQNNRLLVVDLVPCHRLLPSDFIADFVYLGFDRLKKYNIYSIGRVPG